MKRRQLTEERIALIRALHDALHPAAPTMSCDAVEQLACYLVRKMTRANEATERRRDRWGQARAGGVS